MSRNGNGTAALDADHRRQAAAAGLRYASDAEPGWTRQRRGDGFIYLDSDGERIADEDSLDRIRRLVIPPAWDEVWVCPSPRGHLQATGRDQRGRKVYKYHEKYRSHRDETKYHRLANFASRLPQIRERVDADMRQRCMSRERVLATVVHLLDTTHIRIGNDRYAKDNEHFGLTTLRRRHVEVNGNDLVFAFTGKSGQERHIRLHDPRTARAITHCRDLPGYELFKYRDDDGEKHRVGSGDVNEYLREISGEDFTAKHFRTWGGTVIAACVLTSLEPFTDEQELKRNLVTAVKTTAAELGNRPATCRKFYIHPLIFEAYEDGSLTPAMEQAMQKLNGAAARHRMTPEEAAVLALLAGASKRG